tara:strand:+ start:9410 stop:10147 length:738 start_codon:yes stop_codon:yes gene_type:complete
MSKLDSLNAAIFNKIDAVDSLQIIDKQEKLDSLNRITAQKDSIAASIQLDNKLKKQRNLPPIDITAEGADTLTYGKDKAMSLYIKADDLSKKLSNIPISEEEKSILKSTFGDDLKDTLNVNSIAEMLVQYKDLNNELMSVKNDYSKLIDNGKEAGLHEFNDPSAGPYQAMSGYSPFGKELKEFKDSNILPLEKQLQVYYTADSPYSNSKTFDVLQSIKTRISGMEEDYKNTAEAYEKIVKFNTQE